MKTPGTHPQQAGQRVSLTLTVPWRLEHVLSLLGGFLVCGIAALSTWQYLYFPAWFVWQGLLLVILWWLGLGCLLFATDDLTQRWRIVVDADQLILERDGLLGRRVYHWPRRDVAAVTVRPQRGALLPRRQLVVQRQADRPGSPPGAAGASKERTLLHHARPEDLEQVRAAIGRAWNL